MHRRSKAREFYATCGSMNLWDENYIVNVLDASGVAAEMGSTSRLRDEAAPLERHRISVSQKYQPKSFAEIIGQDKVVKYLLRAVAKQDCSWTTFVFAGPRGTGKTSAARVFASALNCHAVAPSERPCGRCRVCAPTNALNKSDAVVLDAASSLDDLASMIPRWWEDSALLTPEWKTTPVGYSFRGSWLVYIVEECELLSKYAWIAFFKARDEVQRRYSETRVTLILITTDDKYIPDPPPTSCWRLLSRMVYFSKVEESDIVKRLEILAAKEGLIVEAGALSLVAAKADGSVRGAEMILDQLCLLGHKSVSIATVQKLQGFSEPSPACELSENLDQAHDAELLMGRSSSSFGSSFYGSSEVSMSSYKAGGDLGLEVTPHEITEPLQAYRTSITSDSRPHGVSEHSLCSSSGSRQDGPSKLQGFSEPSPACELSENLDQAHDAELLVGRLSSTLYDYVPAHNRPLGVSEPLPTPSLSSTSGSRQDGPSKPSPVYKPSAFVVDDVLKQYTWDQVVHMTNGRTSRQLGKGGFGTVYLGKLENGKEVAVKILNRSSQQGIPEFLNEVNLLRRVNHVNLVRLLGYCQDEEQVLVYEFAEEGSIWDHLHGERRWLDWKQRLSIAIQSACGLEYLHTLCSPRIIHRDIKSENILLTKTMIAKVCDFGSSRLGAEQDNNWKTHVTTRVIGTRGYLDPEYYLTGQLRNSSDVYSFGIVLLEIITGRKPVPNSDPKCCISNWVEKACGSGHGSRALKGVADPNFGDNYDPKALKLVLDVARSCVKPSGESRPEISEVVRVLRKAQELELERKKFQSRWFPFL